MSELATVSVAPNSLKANAATVTVRSPETNEEEDVDISSATNTVLSIVVLFASVAVSIYGV